MEDCESEGVFALKRDNNVIYDALKGFREISVYSGTWHTKLQE